MIAVLLTIWALLLGAQTGLPDAAHLATLADSVGIPVELSWAQAWEESRTNLNPYLRGAHGEWGRFQIREHSRIGNRCRQLHLNIRTYAGNTRCHAIVMRELIGQCGIACATETWNGSGPDARAYKGRVAATAYFLQHGERACASTICAMKTR